MPISVEISSRVDSLASEKIKLLLDLEDSQLTTLSHSFILSYDFASIENIIAFFRGFHLRAHDLALAREERLHLVRSPTAPGLLNFITPLNEFRAINSTYFALRNANSQFTKRNMSAI